MTIRKMTKDDLVAVACIEKACFADFWSETSLENSLNSAVTLSLVAEDTDILGYAFFSVIGEEAELLKIATAPSHRKKGVAQKLMEHFLAFYHGSTFLEVRESNVPARSLYEKNGFTVYGIRPHYYSDPTENAILMKKEETV